MTFIEDRAGFYRFLNKFRILDEIRWTETLIADSIMAICDEIKKEQTDFVWLDFSINKYMSIGWHKYQAVQFISDCFEAYLPGRVGLVLSLKYEALRTSQAEYAKLIDDPRAAECLIGLDLVGDEEFYEDQFYAPIFRNWNSAKKMTRAHVGESGSAMNIFRTITSLGASNIAHGLKIVGFRDFITLALERQIFFDMTVSSNFLTGVWEDTTTHPILGMLREGLLVTVGSDDPTQCSTTLNNEFLLLRGMGMTKVEESQLRKNAVKMTSRYYPDLVIPD